MNPGLSRMSPAGVSRKDAPPFPPHLPTQLPSFRYWLPAGSLPILKDVPGLRLRREPRVGGRTSFFMPRSVEDHSWWLRTQ